MNAADIIDGRYRLERLLGTGGMAEVWLAEDQRLRRWVALKALREAFSGDSAADAETVAAFEREATVVARLQHVGIVGVYDAGAHEGRRYIVMEYVHGYSLRQLLETQGRMTEQEAIRYGVQIATALHHAHGQGVVHCDIKPENVLVNESGVAKVADFGVAEILTKTMAPGQAQDLLGTIAYLAPEIIEGADASPASDIYSLGLTIFELVAGRLPFAGTSAGASIGQRLATPAPLLRTFARGASPELESVLARALALSPQDRFPNAAAFASALQRAPAPVRGAAPTPVAAPPGRAPEIQPRHTTARVRRTPPPPRQTGGVSASTIVLAVGVVLAALGLGIAAAVVISRAGDDDNAGTPTPTATTASSTPTGPPATRTAPPTNTASPTPRPSVTPSASPTRTPTSVATPTPTRTPTQGASPVPTTAVPATGTALPSQQPSATP